jgi:hypothetical protein
MIEFIKSLEDIALKKEKEPFVKKIKVTPGFWKELLDVHPPRLDFHAEFYGIPIVVDNNITEPYEVIYQEECERCKVCKSFDSCANAVKDGTAVRCVLFGELKRYIEKENVQ